MKKAEALHAATEEEKGPWVPDNVAEINVAGKLLWHGWHLFVLEGPLALGLSLVWIMWKWNWIFSKGKQKLLTRSMTSRCMFRKC
ncbi:hypothetical protein BDY21DRAFT_332503 [Lineolata rhizophorae]|uniref:Uncharacterized protein n=1 Tax=Lineolata rhizophorae TaxID=578093 RepID=A0A6A6PCN0_9PEZI|nr:hypothetical protein BDY21DRAFT_332503 [Lineolata rhizophorae]